MQLNTDTIEKLLQKILPYYFILVFVTTITGALLGYLEHHSWNIGDWLINYQGGIIRRGLFGEIIYHLSNFTHINPGIYVVVFQIFFYAVFLFFSFALLKKQHTLLPYAFLIFSPFIFTFQINDLNGGFRKEIIYFAILAFVVWNARTKDYHTFEKIFYIILIFYPAVILTHEMLAIYLPFLLVAYFSVVPLTKNKFFILILLLIPSIGSFLVAMDYSQVTSTQITEIFNSILKENYPITGGAISALDKDTSYGISRVINDVNNKDYIYYIVFIFFAAIAYIPIYEKLKAIFRNKFSLLLIFFSTISSIGLFIVAVDWGRFIYIPLVSIFLLSLISTEDKKYHQSYRYNKPVNILIVIFFTIYTLFWHIPHCGSPTSALFENNYKRTNLIVFAKPYVEIAAYYFPRIKKLFPQDKMKFK